jgi:hypothetical protein
VGGLPNIRGNLVRDIAFLNKVEILGWDFWGLVEGDDSDLNQDDLALLDLAATQSLASNKNFHLLRSLYLREMRLRVPPIVRRFDDVTFTYEDILKGDPSLARQL